MDQRVPCDGPGCGDGAAAYAQAIRQAVDQLTHLPGSASVALRFIEIGRDPDSDPADFEKIISSDTNLSAKLLALTNSSWCATRYRVTKISQAINLLGMNNVRTLVISYCMAGIHSRLKLPADQIQRYWQAALCKGVAARTVAQAAAPSLADEAFMAGLFQDIALPVMHHAAGASMLSILEDHDLDAGGRIAAERRLLGVDHAEIGALLATKLELPEPYLSAVACHHDEDRLNSSIGSQALFTAIRVAALFPHVPGLWHAADIERLATVVTDVVADRFPSRESFLNEVQKQFDGLYGYFQPGESSELRLEDMIAEACDELADATTHMVWQLHSLVAEAAVRDAQVNELTAQHRQLNDERRRDSLTGVLNRVGFLAEASACIQSAMRHGKPLALMYFDVDKFKSTNDTYGHQFGDYVLTEVCERVAGQMRGGDLLGRIGGDEFVILLKDVQDAEVRLVSDALMKAVRHGPFAKDKIAETKTISLGVVTVPVGQCDDVDVQTLINDADALMYMAKRAGPGQIRMRTFTGASVG